jgi:hypothetical protein
MNLSGYQSTRVGVLPHFRTTLCSVAEFLYGNPGSYIHMMHFATDVFRVTKNCDRISWQLWLIRSPYGPS